MTAQCIAVSVADHAGGSPRAAEARPRVDAPSATDERHQVAVAAAMGLACAVGVFAAMLVGLLMTVGAVEVEAETGPATPGMVASAE